MSISVVIADDQALVRAGFRVLVDSEPDLEVVGEASTGEEAVAVVKATNPDVVLMDVRMPAMDGLEATRRILAPPNESATRILMLTTFDLDEYVFEAIRAGASGFLLKDTPPNELLLAIRVIAGGDALLAPSVTRRLIAEFASRPASSAPNRRRHKTIADIVRASPWMRRAFRPWCAARRGDCDTDTLQCAVPCVFRRVDIRDRVHCRCLRIAAP